jgi:hypothetical protein
VSSDPPPEGDEPPPDSSDPAPGGVEPAAPPRYTPDGRWFWNRTQWIPAADVLRPRPAPVRPPAPDPARRHRRPWWPWLAAALALVLVAAVTVGVVARRPVVHPAALPAAERVFDLPFADHVSSAGMRGTLTIQGSVLTVSGAVDFTPDRALHATLNLGGAYLGEFLDSNGIDYQTQEPAGPWDEGTPVSFIDGALGWAGGPPPSGLRDVGEQVVGGERAWHLRSAAGANWWIGAANGDPLAFDFRSAQWALKLTFDGFGVQAAIMAPPQSNVSTLPVEGIPRTLVAAPEMSLEVTAVEPAPPVLESPPAGYRYEALDLSYRNQGPEPVTFDNAFTLTDEHGAQYGQIEDVEIAPTLPRNRLLQPGQQVAGWDVFVVSRGDHHLTLRAGPQADGEDLDFLVSIPLS